MATTVHTLRDSVQDQLAELKDDLLCGFHILEQAGQGTGIAGHLTARLPGRETFWTNRWALGFDETTARDLIETDFELKTVTGDGRCDPTLHIHTQIYRVRPDVNCIVHTHASNVVALGITGETLRLSTQTGCYYHDDVAVFDEFDGIVLDTAEGDAIAGALGRKHAVLLKHHGMLTVGPKIRNAVIGALVVDYAAGVQLKAMAAGRCDELSEEAALQAKGFLTAESTMDQRWAYQKRRAKKRRPDIFGTA